MVPFARRVLVGAAVVLPMLLAVPTTAQARPPTSLTGSASCLASTPHTAVFAVSNRGTDAVTFTWSGVGATGPDVEGSATLDSGNAMPITIAGTFLGRPRLDLWVDGTRVLRLRGCHRPAQPGDRAPWPALTDAASVPLGDGRVLLAGGYDATIPGAPQGLPNAYVCVISSHTCRRVSDLPYQDRVFHPSGLLLRDGRALLSGGVSVANGTGPIVPGGATDIYDPASDTWTDTYAGVARDAATLVQLADGTVLATGGIVYCPHISLCTSVSSDVISVPAGEVTPVGDLTAPFVDAATTLLSDGRVLLVTGPGRISTVSYVDGPLADPTTTEIYDPTTGQWSQTGALPSPRTRPVLTSLPGGGARLHSAGATDLEWSPATGAWTESHGR